MKARVNQSWLRQKFQRNAGFARSSKLQAPSSKLQRNTKLQNSKGAPHVALELDVWSFSGAWSLEFGASLMLGALNHDRH
jgi:hypothetical protein